MATRLLGDSERDLTRFPGQQFPEITQSPDLSSLEEHDGKNVTSYFSMPPMRRLSTCSPLRLPIDKLLVIGN